MRASRAVRLLSAVIFVAVLGDVAPAATWEGQVVKVFDGDTVSVKRGRQEVVIRLYGVDAPEKTQEAGPESKGFAAALLVGKTVRVEPVDQDRHGRTVGLVFVDGDKCLNVELVREGHAWFYERYCTREELCAELRRLEEEAREAERGLWAHPNPTPPWDYRYIQRTVPDFVPKEPRPRRDRHR